VTCVAFSANGCRIISASYYGSLIIWDAISGVALSQPFRLKQWVRSVAFSADGSCIICRLERDGTILFDAASGRRLSNFHPVGESDNKCPESIKVTGDSWIIDSVSGRTICQLPPINVYSCHAIHGTSMAVGTMGGQLLVIHFPPALFTILDTHSIDENEWAEESSSEASDEWESCGLSYKRLTRS
jgi:WD40 repeat protein